MKFTLAFMCLALSVTLFGCNTVHGIGADLRKAGDAIADAAKGDSSKK
jgi:predicted small secreted protein